MRGHAELSEAAGLERQHDNREQHPQLRRTGEQGALYLVCGLGELDRR
jgi:hypothetical protein